MITRYIKPPQKPKQPPLSLELQAAILHRWRFSKHNSISAIAADHSITIASVHKVINNFLSEKTITIQSIL